MTREEKQKAIDALKISAPIMAVTQEEFADYIQTLNKIMDWLEQEPCDDAISRRAVLKLFATHDGKYLFEAIRDLPSVTPKQRTGHWIKRPHYIEYEYVCSNCGNDALGTEMTPTIASPYCPWCGARMESEEQA